MKTCHLWGCLLFVACCLLPLPGQAQQPNEPLQVQRGGASSQAAPSTPTTLPGGVIQAQSRPMFLQSAVVVLLTGGAVWTVCRSSRRQ